MEKKNKDALVIAGVVALGVLALSKKTEGDNAGIQIRFTTGAPQVGAPDYRVGAFETEPVTEVFVGSLITAHIDVTNQSHIGGTPAEAVLKLHYKIVVDDGSSVQGEQTVTETYAPGETKPHSVTFAVPDKAGRFINATAELFSPTEVQIATGSGRVLIKSAVYGSDIRHYYWYSGSNLENFVPAELKPSLANEVPAGQEVDLMLTFRNTGNVSMILNARLGILNIADPTNPLFVPIVGKDSNVIPPGGEQDLKFYRFHLDENGAEVIDTATLSPNLVQPGTYEVAFMIILKDGATGVQVSGRWDRYLLVVRAAIVYSGTIRIT